MRRSLILFALLIVLGWASPDTPNAAQGPSDEGKRQVRAILENHCFACHGPDKQEGQLKISALDLDLVKGPDAEHWQEVLDQLNAGTMPPKGKSKLTAGEREQLASWLTAQLKLAAEVSRSSGGRTVLRRLTRYEYNNTLRDLLGVDFDFARDLPPEAAAEHGFQNNSKILVTSSLHLEYFQKIAKRALEKAFGPREKPVPYEITFEPGKVEPGKIEPKKKGGTIAAKKKEAQRNRLPKSSMPANDEAELVLNQFPAEGPVLIRITAWASRTSQGDYPHLRVAMGENVAKSRRTRAVGEIGIEAVADAPRVYEFLVQAEDYPQTQFLAIRNQFDPGTSSLALTEYPVLHIAKIELIAPYYKVWPPETRTRILIESSSREDEKAYAREVIEKFMQRAYRRPVTAPEVTRMHDLFVRLRSNTPSFAGALIDTLSAVLVSPGFLLLSEPAANPKFADKARKLTDHELASRLSFFLWSTMPDDTLFALAEKGKLQDADVLREQVKRMLDHPKSNQFSQRFVTQWLDLESVNRVAVNPEFFPTFKDELKPVMRQETVRFFETVLREDLSCFTLLDSDFAILNASLARHYAIAGVAGEQFRRVALKPADHRGGILTHASILTGNSSGDDTHPVKRGVWVLERLLNDPPPPPPPEVPTLAQNDKKGERLSLTEKLLVHRQANACMNCHQKIDPWGLAFENYDGIGVWRDSRKASLVPVPKKKEGKAPNPVAIREVNANTELPNGARIDGLAELKKHLLAEQRERFAETLVSRIFSYAIWRNLEFSDRRAVQELSQAFRKSDYRIGSLITNIVLSETFRSK